MPKEVIIDITTGIIVFGSVFAAPYWIKIAKRVKHYLDRDELLRKPAQRASVVPYAQNKTAPPSAPFGG